MFNRRSLLASSAAAGLPLLMPWPALAQSRKDSITLAMTLEPPGLDPTAGAASSIGEIVLLLASPRRRSSRSQSTGP